MGDGAGASVKLSARFPQPSALTDLFGQLKGEVSGVKAPDLAGDKIQGLTAGLNIQLPDTSNWHTAIPDDAKGLIGNFPDSSTLTKPIAEPIGKISDLFSFDAGKFGQNQAATLLAPAPAVTDVAATLEALVAPVDLAAKLLADPELLRLLQGLSSITGAQATTEIPQKAAEVTAGVKNVLHDKVEPIVLGFIALVSTFSGLELLRTRVRAATGVFSPSDTQRRLQAVLDQYSGSGATLGAAIAAVNVADDAALAALSGRLNDANDAFQAYVGSLTRDLALTEVGLAMLGISDLQAQLDQIGSAVSKVDWTATNELSSLVTSEIQKVKDKLVIDPAFTIDRYKEAIHTGVAQLAQMIDKFDLSVIVQAIQNLFKTILSPLQKLEDFKTQVEIIVRGALGTIRDAVQKIDLAPLKATVEQALSTLSNSLHQVSQLFDEVRTAVQTALNTVKTALDGVKTFVLDPQSGLKKKIEDVFHAVNEVLDALKIQDVVNEVKATLQPVNDALVKIEFQPIINAVIQAIGAITDVLKTVGPLVVTDALKQKLTEATAFLQQIDFGQIGDTLTGAFDEILKSVDQDALGEFKTQYDDVVANLKNFDPEPALREVQKDVFDPLLTELEKIHPGELLKPVQDAFQAAAQALAKFHPAETFSFMTDFFQSLLAKIEEISPTKLLAPVEKMLDDLRKQIDSLLHIDAILAAFEKFKAWAQAAVDASDLFGSVLNGYAAGHAQMKDAIANFDGGVFLKIVANLLDGALSRLGAIVNLAGLSGALAALAAGPGDLKAKLTEMQQELTDGSNRLAGLDAQGALTTLRARHGEVTAAFAARTGADLPVDVSASIQALDPMAVLAPMLPKIDRVKSAAAAKATQFGEIAAPFAAVLDALGGALNLLHTLLSPLSVLRDLMLAPTRALFPGQNFSGPRDLLVHLLNELSPDVLRPAFEPVFGVLHGKLKALVDDAVLKPVGEALQTLKGATGMLNIHSLVDAINGAFQEIENIIKALNPALLIQEIDAQYKEIAGVLDKLNPAVFIQEVTKIYADDIVGVIQQISPEGLLLPPLRELFQKITAALGAFDIQAIFKPVLDRLQSLDSDLGNGLHQVEGAWQEMLAVLSSAGGGSASVSVSVHAG